MRIYDEDAFFGSGEYEVLTVDEVFEYLTEEEKSVFNKIVDRAVKRRNKAESKSKLFSRGYENARANTNDYKGITKMYWGSNYEYSDMLYEEELFTGSPFDYF